MTNDRRKWLFDIGDYRRDTGHLSTLEHGAYRLLLDEYWVHGGLPSDDISLRTIVGCDWKTWRRIKPKLKPFFHDGWRHKRIDADLATDAGYRERKRKAARKRWNGGQEQLPMPVDKSNKACSAPTPPKSLKNKEADHARASYLSKKEDKLFLSGAPRVERTPESRNKYREKLRARQTWEAELLRHLGPINGGDAIDLLVADPALVDRCTDAELRRAGQGAVAALIALKHILDDRNPPQVH